MQKSNVLNSPRLLKLKKHRRRVSINKILLSVLALVAVFALFAFLSRLDALNIKEIQISGNKIVDTEALKSTVGEQIAGKYFWLFPKTNILYYSKNTIKNILQNKFKRLKDINLSIKDNEILLVSLTERVALYTWCGAILPEGSEVEPQNKNEVYTEKCYFIDKDGYIFDEAPYFSGEVYFKFYGLAQSDFYFSPDIFQKLILFKETLEHIGLKPVVLYIQDNGDIEMFLSGKKFLMGPKIIFKSDADFQKLAENLEAAIKTEPLQSNLKNKYSSLLYIDLRFGNKVYYKFK